MRMQPSRCTLTVTHAQPSPNPDADAPRTRFGGSVGWPWHASQVISADFFLEAPAPEPWDFGATTVSKPKLDVAKVQTVRTGPRPGHTDLEVAIALAALAHDELLAFGTGGGEQLTDTEIGLVLTALRAVTKRLAVAFEPPYRNFSTFKSYWLRNKGYNSWQARREMLEQLFEPLRTTLVRMEEQTFDALAEPVSPHTEVGWPLVDEEVRELRRRFQTASTPQDYRAIGTHCIGVLQALGRTVYDTDRHLPPGESVPPIDKTKQRIGRYVEDALPGEYNHDVRGLAVKTIELAHHVYHSPDGSTRREAGIAADAVILLANILRRLEQDL